MTLFFYLFNSSIDIARAKELCGENYQCQFDYALTLNRDMAHFTKNYYDTYTEIKTTNSKRSELNKKF